MIRATAGSLLRIAAGAALMFLAGVVLLFATVVSAKIIPALGEDVLPFSYHLAFAFGSVGGYIAYRRWLPNRSTPSLAQRRAPGWLLATLAAVLLTAAATTALLAIGGCYHVSSTRNWFALVGPAGLALTYAVFDELLFRGVIFGEARRSLPLGPALLLSSAAYALSHASEPGANMMTLAALAFGFGPALAALALRGGGLVVAIGANFAWHLDTAGVFGWDDPLIPVDGWIEADIDVPDWLAGWGAGLGASPVFLMFGMIVAVALLRGGRGAHAAPKRVDATSKA
jgi:membrane protease YdiL (CAAX protease family)